MHSSGSAYTVPVILIALAVVIGSVFGGYVVFIDTPHEASPAKNLIAEKNDTVSVDYIGMFTDGTVFDTSLPSVAMDNINYPKAVSFTPRATYSPANFTVGARQMIIGFDDGVLGMFAGETKTITVPPSAGYGNADPTKISTWSLFEETTIYNYAQTISGFSQNYSTEPLLGTMVKDNYYGWNDTVYFIDETSHRITLRYQPTVGQLVSPHRAWKSKVVSIDESANSGKGRIVLQNLLTSSDVNRVKSTDTTGQEFRVVGVDPATKTYTIDYNRETMGKTLIFRITILSITKAKTTAP